MPCRRGAGPAAPRREYPGGMVIKGAKSVVGLDLGSSVVKAIELTMQGIEPVITGFGRAEVGADGDVSAAVRQLFEQNQFKSKRVATGVSGQSTVVRYVPMVPMSDSELRQAIHFEVDKYLPFDVDEVVMDCQAMRSNSTSQADSSSSSEASMTVLLAACRRELVQEQIETVQGRGLTPIAVDLDLFAIANAWELCGSAEAEGDSSPEGRAIALIDVGASRTSINVVRGGESCFSREINIAGGDMTQAIARRLGVESCEAEALKRQSETLGSDVESAIAPVLEDLASELLLSIDYVEHHESVQVEELLLSGGGILVPGVTSYIGQTTSRPARAWNPLEGLRIDVSRVDVEELEAWAPSLVVAVGLAAKVRTS